VKGLNGVVSETNVAGIESLLMTRAGLPEKRWFDLRLDGNNFGRKRIKEIEEYVKVHMKSGPRPEI
jgi:hypothetical protein